MTIFRIGFMSSLSGQFRTESLPGQVRFESGHIRICLTFDIGYFRWKTCLEWVFRVEPPDTGLFYRLWIESKDPFENFSHLIQAYASRNKFR